jgi:hypothetical protein
MNGLQTLIEIGLTTAVVAAPIVAAVALLVRDDPLGLDGLGATLDVGTPHLIQEEYDVRWNVALLDARHAPGSSNATSDTRSPVGDGRRSRPMIGLGLDTRG